MYLYVYVRVQIEVTGGFAIPRYSLIPAVGHFECVRSEIIIPAHYCFS